MSKLCAKCGTACPDDSVFCHGCGSPMPAQPAPQLQYQQPQYQQPQYQAPQQPQYHQYSPQYQTPQYPQYSAPRIRQPMSNKKVVLTCLIIMVAIFALAAGFVNVIGCNLMCYTREYHYNNQTENSTYGVQLSDFREDFEEARKHNEDSETLDAFSGIMTSTYIFGIGCLVAALLLFIAAYLFITQKYNAKALFLCGAIGLMLVAGISIIMALTGNSYSSGGSYDDYSSSSTIAIPWTYWVAAAGSLGLAISGVQLAKDE